MGKEWDTFQTSLTVLQSVTDWLLLTQTMTLVVYQPEFLNVAFNFNGRV